MSGADMSQECMNNQKWTPTIPEATVNQNWFPTLNTALESEGLIDTWKSHYPSIGYDQSFNYTFDDGTKYGRHVSIYRNDEGLYERPVTYRR